MKCVVFFKLFIIPFILFGQSKKTLELIESIKGEWKLDENNYVTYIEIVELNGKNKDFIYQKSENYFAYKYNDANSVLQVRNMETGTLIGKGLFGDIHTYGPLASAVISTGHILKIECKDNRARITLSLTEYEIVLSSTQGVQILKNDISIFYPINDNGLSKNNYAVAFYNSHIRALKAISDIVAYLQADGINNAEDDW